jgi:hypothetical protein
MDVPLTALEVLEIGGCKVEELPQSFGSLTDLKKVDVCIFLFIFCFYDLIN